MEIEPIEDAVERSIELYVLPFAILLVVSWKAASRFSREFGLLLKILLRNTEVCSAVNTASVPSSPSS